MILNKPFKYMIMMKYKAKIKIVILKYLNIKTVFKLNNIFCLLFYIKEDYILFAPLEIK